ncbi:MAG: hypothetical protein ACTIOL_00335 [Enterococcus sp.]
MKLMLDSRYKNIHKNIVFVTNGIISDSVRPNWEMYKSTKENENVTVTSVLLPDLVKMVKEQGFNESLFDKGKRSELRKCLYYLDESDYKLDFFENIINQYFEEISNMKSNIKIKRLFSSLNMMFGLVNHNAIEKKRYRISIKFSEYVLMKMWQYLKKQNKFEDEELMMWLNKFIKVYIYSNEKYIDNLTTFSESSEGIPIYNPVEYRLLCFEILGNLCTYGIFLKTTDFYKYFNLKHSSRDVMNLLVNLMNNNYGFYYPVYDNDGIEVSLLFYFALLERGNEAVEILLEQYTSHIYTNIINKKYPVLERQYSIAMEVEFGEINYAERYSASYLWGVIYEWAILMEKENLRTQIINFDFIVNITIQNWNAFSVEESKLYNKNEVHGQGYTDILNDCEVLEIQKLILDRTKNVDFNRFSFIEYSLPVIGLMVSKKYRIPIIPNYWRREFIK